MKKINNRSILSPIFKSGVLMLTLLLFLTGCQLGLGEAKQTVIPPERIGVSIEGLYAFDSLFSLEGEKFIDESGFRKFGAQFNLSQAKVGLEEINSPTYVGKLVNSYDYFLEKYRINPSELEITQERIEVVSISTSDKQFYDVFRLDDDEIAIIKGSNLIKLHRAKEGEIINFSGSDNGFGSIDNSDDSYSYEPRAGVLLGLKGKRDSVTGNSAYRTLWITNDGELQDVYEVDDILFPRKEFWTLKVIPSSEDNDKESLEIKAITGPLKEVDQEFTQEYDGQAFDLTFVGNNYISLLIKNDKFDFSNQAPQAMTVSLDNKNIFTPVMVGDLIGPPAEAAFRFSLEESLGSEVLEGMDDEAFNKFNSNFILKRHHGNWRMESRITLDEKILRIPVAYKPTENVVTYDDLPISWQEIKRKIPQAQDAFCAPGKSFLLVRTSKYLAMYGIDGNNNLTEAPLQRIEIDETDEIIMAEWARGDFVHRWTDVVAKIGQRIIFVQN